MHIIRRTLKITLLSILGVFTAFLVGVTLCLNVIFTPERITPVIVEVLNQQLNAEVQCKRVELTFFSTFPRVGAKLEDTYIKSLQTGTARDTLASFHAAHLSFDISQYLKHKNIVIQELKIEQPKLYAFLGRDGSSNWEILKESEPSEADTNSLEINHISIKNFEIDHATLAYEDEITDFIYQVESFSLQVQAKKNDHQMHFEVLTKSNGIQVYLHQNPVYRLSSIGADLTFDYDKRRGDIKVASKDVTVNNIHFEAEGVLVPKGEERGIDVQLQTRLTTNSIDHFLSFVPAHFLPRQDIKTTGKVRFDIGINGFYGRGKLPQLDMLFSLEDGSLVYKNFPGKIDVLETVMTGKIDPNNTQPSFVTVDKLLVQGTGIDIQANGRADDILNQAQVKAQLVGNLDLTELYKKFPMDPTVFLNGKARVDVSSEFSINQLQQEKYDQLNVAGMLDLEEVSIQSKLDSLAFTSKAMAVKFYRELKVYNKTYGDIKVDNTVLSYKNNLDFNAKTLHLNGVASKTKGRKPVIKLTASMEDVKGGIRLDSISVALRRAQLKGDFYPGDTAQPSFITSDFTIDSVGIRQAQNFVGIQQGSYQIRLDKKAPKKWLPSGGLSFNSMIAVVPELGSPISMPVTALSFVNDNFSLDHARVKFGETDVTLTGKIEHALGFYTGNMVKAKLFLQSDFINANQLMLAFAGGTSTAQAEAKDTTEISPGMDTTATQMHAFRIPDSLRFEFQTDISKVKFGYSSFDKVQGTLKLRDGNLYLNNFKLKTLAADLDADMIYSAKSKDKAAVDFTFYLSGIEMSRLNEFMPLLDTLFPMSQSFMGKMDFRMKGTAELDQNMDIDIATFKGIGAMKARDIMVLDGPTFRDLAKVFMFKNKELNPIKQLEAEMEFAHAKVNILPALLEIDRYKLAIGGVQHLDMSYDYHISVLESPVPFKTGVDVKGKYTDYTYKVTKAKYKYYFSDKERLINKRDPAVVNKKKGILQALNF